MSDDNQIEENVTQVEEPVVEEVIKEEPATPEAPKDDIESIVEERLAKMKANMDRMASERDEALKLKVN